MGASGEVADGLAPPAEAEKPADGGQGPSPLLADEELKVTAAEPGGAGAKLLLDTLNGLEVRQAVNTMENYCQQYDSKKIGFTQSRHAVRAAVGVVLAFAKAIPGLAASMGGAPVQAKPAPRRVKDNLRKPRKPAAKVRIGKGKVRKGKGPIKSKAK